MLLPDLRAEVARYARKMAQSGLVRATQGNLSARDPHSGYIAVTPSGTDYDLLTPEDVVVVDASGAVVEGKLKPTVETPLHTLILSRRSDVHCVMHTHSIFATVFGVTYQDIPAVLAESALCLGDRIPIAPYQMSGTPEFAQLIADTLGEASAIIWGNHGAMVTGQTLGLAFSAAHALEDAAKVYYLAKLIGTPSLLPPEEVRRLHAFWSEHYGQRHLISEREG